MENERRNRLLKYHVYNVNGYDYLVSFIREFDCTFCSITDIDKNFVVTAGHSVLSPNDEDHPIEGMKQAMERALAAPPSLFNRRDRSIFWRGFWSLSFQVDVDNTPGVGGFLFPNHAVMPTTEAVFN